MFCSHCGTYLERDLEICPYCREGQQGAIEDIESHNKEKLKQICPDINNLVTFNFMGYKYTFDSCYSRFINAYRFLEKLLYINKDDFVRKMVTIQDFDVDYADQLYILAVDSLKKTALLTEALFHREHIQENYDKIYEVYQNSFQLLFQKVKQELREMDKQKAEYDRNRTNKYQKKMENNYKTRWIGGGYGIAGAIRGSLEASMMNAGASILTGMASTAGYISSNVIANSVDRKQRSERFNSELFRIEIAEYYTYALKKILQWSCEVIDKELSKKIFKGELQKRAKVEIANLKKNMPQEELIRKCCDILSYNPYYEEVYVYMYKNIKEATSKDIILLGSNFWGNTFGIKYAFMQSDVDSIKKCTCSLDDMEEVSQRKFKDLQKLAKKNLEYGDFELATTEIACDYKDKYVRNWFQAAGYKIRNTVGYRNKEEISPIRWDYAETNAAYAYSLYAAFEGVAMEYENVKDNGKILLDENQNLQRQIQHGNKTAICIWAALHARYAISKNKPASKYMEVVWKLSAQGNSLAMSLVGEWFDEGVEDYPKNKYIADMFFRLAMLQGSPYAISYIGCYYKYGYAGYPRDKVFANELFNLAIEVPLSRSMITQ